MVVVFENAVAKNFSRCMLGNLLVKNGVLGYRSKAEWLWLLDDSASVSKACNKYSQWNSLYDHIAHKEILSRRQSIMLKFEILKYFILHHQFQWLHFGFTGKGTDVSQLVNTYKPSNAFETNYISLRLSFIWRISFIFAIELIRVLFF